MAAQTWDWTGTTSSDWTVGSNWSTGTAPVTGGIVVISTNSNLVLGVNGAATGASGNFTMGSTGADSLTIENGSTLTSNGTTESYSIGTIAGGTSTVTVTGTGSQWIADGEVQVGTTGKGILNIENGASVVATDAVRLGVVTGAGTLNINDGTLETSLISVGTKSLANFDNAILRANSTNAAWITGVGTLNIEAGGLTIDTNGFAVGTASRFQGVGGLTKIGAGMLTLSGDSNYAGETVIDAGTLALTGTGSISSSSRVVANSTFDISGLTGGGTSIQSLAGSGSGTVNLGAKTLTLTNANDLFFGIISGTGGLTLNAGMETLFGANNYSGATTVSGGTLRAGAAGAFSAASAFVTDAGTTLDLNGFSQTLASLSNAGTVRLGGTPGTVLTVNGNYVGNGGTLLINTALAGDTSATDELVVDGSTSGTTSVKVTNVGGQGAQTVNGIRVVDVAGASNGVFTLQGNYVFQGQQAVIGGAYAYTLQQNGVTTPTDGDWYLRSSLIDPPAAVPPGPIYQPGVPLYESYGQVLLGFLGLPTLQQRVGYRYWDGANLSLGADVPDSGAYQQPIWMRIDGTHTNMQPNATASANYNDDQYKVEMGLDFVPIENNTGRLVAGATAQYGLVSANIASVYGNGKISSNGYSIGGTLTWYGANGFYVDGQSQITWFSSDLSSGVVGSLVGNNFATGYAAGLESGYRIGLGNGWSLTPQGQLAFSSVHFGTFTDPFGAQVSSGNPDSLLGRLGLALDQQSVWKDSNGQLVGTNVYGIANLYYQFLGDTNVLVGGTNLFEGTDKLWGGLGVGGTYSWGNGRYALYGQLTANSSLDHLGASYDYTGTGGFRLRF